MRARALLVDRVVPLLEEGIDVAIRIGTLPVSSLTAIPVGSVRRMVCASPGYLAEHGIPQHPDMLPQHATISTAAAERAPRWAFRLDGRAHEVDVASRLSVSAFNAAIVAALHGWGLTQCRPARCANICKTERWSACWMPSRSRPNRCTWSMSNAAAARRRCARSLTNAWRRYGTTWNLRTAVERRQTASPCRWLPRARERAPERSSAMQSIS